MRFPISHRLPGDVDAAQETILRAARPERITLEKKCPDVFVKHF